MSIIEKLNKLVELKNNLVENLNAQNIPSTEDEKFNTLVPKVLDMGSDATATAEDIAVGKTAYVSSGKVTGIKEEVVQNVEWASENNSGMPTIIYGSSTTVNNVSLRLSTLINYVDHIRIPNYITEIQSTAFMSCTTLKSVDFLEPSSLVSINNGAFANCTSLTSIKLPYSLATIYNGAFQGCTSLSNIILPASLTSINSGAFAGCTSLSDVQFSTLNGTDLLSSIGDGAFSGCTSLVGINLPSSVTTIGKEAFKGCTSLIGIRLPSSLTFINNKFFYDCTKLQVIEYYGTIDEWTNLPKGTDWCKNMGSNSDINCTCVISRLNNNQTTIAVYFNGTADDFWMSNTNTNPSMGGRIANGAKVYSTSTGAIIGVYFEGTDEELADYISSNAHSIGTIIYSAETGDVLYTYA